MKSSSDDALRERAKHDENAAELLRLAVERGLISEEAAETAHSEVVRTDSTTVSDTGPSWIVDALHHTGVLDHDTLAELAREMGLYDSDVSVPDDISGLEEPSSDPFDVLPVKRWDRYEFVKFIGRGGMGDVYKAKDPRLGRFVALKFLRRDEPEIMRRFIREARVQARIDHDNVCQVYEVGEVEGHSYIAMQYISGGSLKEISDLLSIDEKVAIMVDVADALHAAHQAGLIHRDVKPANILLERSDDHVWRPFVVDFGIARDVDSRDMTVSGMVLGTPAFAAPEQVRGEVHNLDRRTDIYSLGATLYWFLTDQAPYEGGYPEILAGITNREPAAPHRINPQIPVDLETIVLKCLEKEPDRRYLTAREVSEDLRRFLAGEAITARPASLIYKVRKKIRKHRGLTAAVAVMVAAVLMVTSLAVHSNFQARRQAIIAQGLLEQVGDIERLLRIGSMMPLHDRRHEREDIKGRMRQIEDEMTRLGPLSQGPGHYALGRGYLALKDLDTAREHLEAALASDYRTSGVTYTLGLVLGRLYERQLQQVHQISDEYLREAFRSEIITKYRKPGLELLRESGSSPTEATDYAEGLIALYEGRYDEALAKAEQAAERVEWLYEARILTGDIHRQLGAELTLQGNYESALEHLEKAGAAYDAAAEIARSDAAVYEGNCARWFQTMESLGRRGATAEGAYRGALEQCGLALRVDPDLAAVHERLARLHWRWADIVHDGGDDPSSYLELAVAAAEKAIEIDPSRASAYSALGGALTVAARFEMANGRDPRSRLLRAVKSFERSIEHQPGMVLAHDDLGYTHEIIARYEMSVGVDPRPSLERAIASFRRAIELNPNYPNAHNNVGIALWRRGYYELKTGLDPLSSLEEAVGELTTATNLNPHYAYAFANLGLARRTRALYAIENDQDPTAWVELARESLRTALSVNPKVFWAYPERSAVELIAARWAMRRGTTPEPYLDRAAEAARRALEVNPANAAAFQNAAEVHRWRAVWLSSQGLDAGPEIEAGRRLTARALEINPSLVNALVTDAALLLVSAEGARDPGRRDELVRRGLATLQRATEINPLVSRDAARLASSVTS